MIAEYETSHWIQNLRSDPQVEVCIKDRRFGATARVLGSGKDATSPDLATIRQVQDLSRAKYGWGQGTVVELIPLSS